MPHLLGLVRRVVLALSVLAAIQGCDLSPTPAVTESAASGAFEAAAGASVPPGGTSHVLPPVAVNMAGAVLKEAPREGRPATQVAYGGTQTTESDVSVAYYPGARQDPSFGMRASTPMGQLAMVKLLTRDHPDQVLNFYREQVRGLWRGERTYSEGPGDDGKGLKLQAESLGGERTVAVILSQDGPDMVVVIQSQYFAQPQTAEKTSIAP